MRYILLSLLFAISTICQAESATKYPCSQKDEKAIAKSISTYLDKHSGIPFADVNLENGQCLNSFASAKLVPKKPVTDTATVLLHKIKNKWEVMALGTDFDEKILSQLPKELRPY